MEGKVITRFAPSPTGYLHGGNYRTAIFAYLFAKQHGGTFVLRIEDTDRERSKKEYEENIYETLDWLNLLPDETYRQSEQAPRHQELLKRLIAEDKAYVSKEDLKEPEGAPVDTAGRRREVIRFRNPKKPVTFVDMIRGAITIDTTDLGDFVIARSDTEPVFHFAVVVDDADAGITHVIRGEDHISNTPRQILIGEALGFTTPLYAHLPLVLNTDRAKLSKRRGAKALTEYRDLGYLPEAMINYLVLLGWHPEGDKEIYTMEELLKEFSLERIQKSSGIFDEGKLTWFNAQYIKSLTDEECKSRFLTFVAKKHISTPAYLAQAIPLLKERSSTLGEALQALQAGEYSFLDDVISYDKKLLLQSAKADAGAVATHIEKVLGILQETSESFTPEKIKEMVFPYATEVGRSAILWPMRVALSGKEKSPDPFTLAGLLGKEKTLARLRQARSMLE